MTADIRHIRTAPKYPAGHHLRVVTPAETLDRAPRTRMDVIEGLRAERAIILSRQVSVENRLREIEARLIALTGVDETFDDGGPDAA